MPRAEFSKRTRAEAFARCGGKCEACGAHLKVGEGEYDHVLPAAMGGANDLGNVQVLCVPCHRAPGTGKTSADAAMIAKTKRMKAKADGSWPRSRARIASRGFASTRPEVE